jgi:KDO2-lipid IV(A) lauroyltransferase
MKRLAFVFTLLIVYPLSLLPFFLLYRLSDLLFVVIYYIVHYRRKVVNTNLAKAFPEKTEEERRLIAHKFYRNFCDLIVEGIKITTISPEELQKRLKVTGTEGISKLYEQGRSAMTTLGHCGNWEMAGLAASYEVKHHSIAIYRPLNNKYFDSFIKRTRARFGMELVAHNRSRQILSLLDKQTILYHFITDQTPQNAKGAYWTIFLNQDTPIYMGAEKVAKMTNMPVFYCKILRVKRGYYSLEVQEVVMDPSICAPNEITEIHTRLLEENIREQPDNWLWSHRRWKRRKPEKL